MTRVIYTGGVSPFGDGTMPPGDAIRAFVAEVRRRMPSITDHGVNVLVKRACGLVHPRTRNRVVAILGRDILTERPEDMWYWWLLPETTRQAILAHPVVGGSSIRTAEQLGDKLKLMTAMDRSSVNRDVLVVTHRGRQLGRTYVWSQATDWEQDMDPGDVDILLSFRDMGRLFVRADNWSGGLPARAYSHIPVLETHVARTTADISALGRQFSRTHHHQGVSVPDAGKDV